MTELPDNILHLPQYQVLGCKSTDDEMHFQVDVPDPIACEECGVQGEFVRQAGHSLGGPPPIHLPGLQDNIQAPATGDGGRIPYDTAAA